MNAPILTVGHALGRGVAEQIPGKDRCANREIRFKWFICDAGAIGAAHAHNRLASHGSGKTHRALRNRVYRVAGVRCEINSTMPAQPALGWWLKIMHDHPDVHQYRTGYIGGGHIQGDW
jgi:hypothetical protein